MNWNKVLGSLIGLHVGDSLGATLEFGPPSKQHDSHTEITGGGHFKWRAGQPTDDTDLMIALLSAIEVDPTYTGPTLNLETFSTNMIKWLDRDPPDVGLTTSLSIGNLEMLTEYTHDEIRTCGGRAEHNKSNGSLMRVAPMMLCNDNDLVTQTMATHGHPLCVLCDQIFVSLLKQFINYDTLSIPTANEYVINALSKDFPKESQVVKEMIDDPNWNNLATSGYVVHTLGSALWALNHTDNFETGVTDVVNRGDDADTCGAVTGALLGAYHGYDAIPSRWTEVIECHDTIVELVNGLIEG